MLQGWTEPNSFHVCVTSYKQFFRGYAAFTRVRWRCLVIDEMQRVKGLSERHWEAVFTLQRYECLPLPGSCVGDIGLICRHTHLPWPFVIMHPAEDTQSVYFIQPMSSRLPYACLPCEIACPLNIFRPSTPYWTFRHVFGFVCSQQRLLLIDAPLHNTFLELWTMVHFLIPGISRPYLHFPLKAPNEENQDYYHKVVIRLHRVRVPRTGTRGARGP